MSYQQYENHIIINGWAQLYRYLQPSQTYPLNGSTIMVSFMYSSNEAARDRLISDYVYNTPVAAVPFTLDFRLGENLEPRTPLPELMPPQAILENQDAYLKTTNAYFPKKENEQFWCQFWLNAYECKHAKNCEFGPYRFEPYLAFHAAQTQALPNRLALIPVTFTFNQGDGL